MYCARKSPPETSERCSPSRRSATTHPIVSVRPLAKTSVTLGNDREFSRTVRAVDVAAPMGSFYDSSALVVDCEGVVHVLGAQMFTDDFFGHALYTTSSPRHDSYPCSC